MPKDSSPVDCSSTSAVTTVLSGADPGLLVTSTFLKKPRFLMRCCERCILVAVERVALDQLKLAADHLVEGANIADDVDPLDIDLWTLLHVEGNVDGMVFTISRDVRLDLDKGITAVAEGISQHRNRFFDSIGIVPVAGVDRQKRQHRLGGKSLSLMLTSTLPKR